ncbi:histidinol-phosphatase [Algoriphagus halophytocola]|uniref:Histidinol-phosphatase n=1 Tax=Algoriphagus halophytocola TaxID=2991499 RepID=A0ABY6MM21_9BACT|nr:MULTISPECIES: histidinol-phosphatase [unclassified Algoriphagus]UZD24708.1 histidinol-phosphatase [Algoriphagus sp. TR-M5]WBL42076.1 histidinol-phosphatase [Algoriphagus sp. TR-M9]
MKNLPLLCVLSALIFVSCKPGEKVEKPSKQWYKGNLHTHSYWSDGDDYPEMIMDWYKSHEYDFVVLSDHNTLAQGEKWKLIPRSPSHEMGFEKYLDKYGDQVVYREDSAGRVEVKLKTLAEYAPMFEEEGEFLIIQSQELTESFESKPLHMNVTNIQQLIPAEGGNSIPEILQNGLDRVKAQRDSTGIPMFLHLNHPNFIWAITPEDIIQLEGERFFEVYNGHPQVNNYGDSLRPSMEVLWDKVQAAYLQAGKPLLYGLAVDDAHNYHVFDQNSSNPGRGWVMVLSESLAPASLIEAMEKGDFYSTTGVTMNEINFDGETLSVAVQPENGVAYTIQFFGTKKSNPSESGVLLKDIKGVTGDYTLEVDDMYVRAKIISSKPKENPYQIGDKEVAWTQPVVAN